MEGKGSESACPSLWLAPNPSKRWGELFFLCYTPFWLTLCLGIIVPCKLYESFTELEYLLLGLVSAVPSFLLPVLFVGKADRGLGWKDRYWVKHSSLITGVSTTSGSSCPVLVSSSLDGTCKVWDLVLGRVIQTVVYPLGITASVLHPAEQLVFCGSLDGRIFINNFDIGLIEEPNSSVSKDQPVVLQGHNGAITALAFCRSGLASASEDCTICIWDYIHWTITQKFNHQKGPVTNLVVIPRSSLPSAPSNRRVSNTFHVSSLEKYPQPTNLSKETITLLSSSCFLKESQASIDVQHTDSCHQTLDSQLQIEWTPEAMQMRVETSFENRMWAMRMTKHVIEMNRHLQSRLLDLMQSRLSWSNETNTSTNTKRKKLMVESPCDNNNGPTLQGEDQSKSPS